MENNTILIQIKYDQIDNHGDVIAKNAISTKNLLELQSSSKINDFEINDNGIMIIKSFTIDHVSICDSLK